MAWYDTNKYGGHKGAYGKTEPGYGRNPYPEHVPLVVQSEYHNAQRYEYQAEEVVEYRRAGGLNIADHNGSPRTRDGYKHQGLGNKAHLVPWKPTHDWSDGGRESSPKPHYEKTKGGSPRYYNNDPHGLNNHKRTYGDRYNNSSSGDEDSDSGSDYEKRDVVCEDGVCYPNSGNRVKPINHFQEDAYEKPKGKPYGSPRHTAPHSTQPSNDPYYEKPSNPHYYENPNRNTHSAPAYVATSPVATQDGKRTYYGHEQPPNTFSRNPLHIVTKPRDEGHRGTIDSSEAKKRYGGVTVPTEPKYSGTIDCKEAAKRYNGIFVPGNNF